MASLRRQLIKSFLAVSISAIFLLVLSWWMMSGTNILHHFRQLDKGTTGTEGTENTQVLKVFWQRDSLLEQGKHANNAVDQSMAQSADAAASQQELERSVVGEKAILKFYEGDENEGAKNVNDSANGKPKTSTQVTALHKHGSGGVGPNQPLLHADSRPHDLFRSGPDMVNDKQRPVNLNEVGESGIQTKTQANGNLENAEQAESHRSLSNDSKPTESRQYQNPQNSGQPGQIVYLGQSHLVKPDSRKNMPAFPRKDQNWVESDRPDSVFAPEQQNQDPDNQPSAKEAVKQQGRTVKVTMMDANKTAWASKLVLNVTLENNKLLKTLQEKMGKLKQLSLQHNKNLHGAAVNNLSLVSKDKLRDFDQGQLEEKTDIKKVAADGTDVSCKNGNESGDCEAEDHGKGGEKDDEDPNNKKDNMKKDDDSDNKAVMTHNDGSMDSSGSSSLQKIGIRNQGGAANDVDKTTTITVRPNSCHDCFHTNFSTLIDHKGYCKQMPFKPRVMLLISSAPVNVDQRWAIRETWGSKCQDPYSAYRCLFVVGRAKDSAINAKLVAENEQYHDILQFGFHDSYFNLTYKTMTSLNWMATHCPEIPYFMKTDDDMFVNTELIPILLEATPSTDFMSGFCWGPSTPSRDTRSKWYVPFYTYARARFPPMCSGTGYIMSQDVIQKVLTASRDIPFFHLEDVYIALCLHNYRIHFRRIRGFNNMFTPFQECSYKFSVMTSHQVSPNQLRDYWYRMKQCPGKYPDGRQLFTEVPYPHVT